jgi:integrase
VVAPGGAQAEGITASTSPHTLRHFLFTWLKTQGIDDALIQPHSGNATRQSLEPPPLSRKMILSWARGSSRLRSRRLRDGGRSQAAGVSSG